MEAESSGIMVTSTASLASTSSTGRPRPAWIWAPRSVTVRAAREAAERVPSLWAWVNRLLGLMLWLMGLSLSRLVSLAGGGTVHHGGTETRRLHGEEGRD